MNKKDIVFHLEILSKNQTDLLFKFKLPKNYYLAGGTALALYLGHRSSLDFDFYTNSEFDREEILNLLNKNWGEEEENVIVSSLEKNFFIGEINKINVSVFHYPHKLLAGLINLRHVLLASLNDIAAMKIIAVIQRPAKRDYIDLYYLLKQYPLETIFQWAEKKYSNFNPYLALRALSFFDDIEDERIGERGIKILDKNFSWKKAKEEIFAKVKKYQLAIIKK